MASPATIKKTARPVQTGWRSVYTPGGKVNFTGLQGKSGVYYIKEGARVVYIGFSASNLYKTMLRHFQTWNHAGQDVVSYAGRRKTYKVKILFLTPAQAAKTESAEIRKYKPRDNRAKLAADTVKRKKAAPLPKEWKIRTSTPWD